MTVLSRGARVRRGGRRPGWVLLTTLLVLAIGASSALVFTNRVELLKLAVILALWAAVAGAFVSVVYRRQADADQARARDMKLVYDLQLDREIAARREYELTVESQLRRELAVELRGAAADEVAALRAELSALRTSLEILFDADLEHRPALETVDKEAHIARAVADRIRTGESQIADWLSSDSVPMGRHGESTGRAEEAIIDVPEVGVLPSDERVGTSPFGAAAGMSTGGRESLLAQPPAGHFDGEHPGERDRMRYDAEPAQPDLRYEPRHRPPPSPAPPPAAGSPGPAPQTDPSALRPAAADGQWWLPGAPGNHWASEDFGARSPAPPSGRRRRARHSSPEEEHGDFGAGQVEVPGEFGGRRSRSRHAADYRQYGVGTPGADSAAGGPHGAEPPPPTPPAGPPPPRLATPPAPEPAARHRSPDSEFDDTSPTHDPDSHSGGQSVADLMARLQVEPSGGGRRRRRDG
ncbi:hypothetical protein MB901379_04506 [Mycobacterium basiliense]|uniref:DUF6779 domain-containing protein n=1 Tax=Mycobacterium basiliense TaxID=2094119 RepID=A0A447GK64_9MYCO|nr:DUF6779 domain-containing protein [Mycobacterium basiliense]VDM90897.1 hypothetical protein MB901379_04506 [Mycobacterium basiliense]